MNLPIIPSTDIESKLADDNIVAFNKSHLPPSQEPDFVALNFHIKDEKDHVIAAINATKYVGNVLYVDVLFVEEAFRYQQFGTRLLDKVESEARALGAKLAHLDTFDWQAKEFYLKAGYEIFGVLDDCPSGHQRFYMKKVL